MSIALEYSDRPLEYDLSVLGADLTFSNDNYLHTFVTNHSVGFAEVGFILSEVLGHSIKLTTSTAQKCIFDSLGTVQIHFNGIPFQKRLSFSPNDLKTALKLLLPTSQKQSESFHIDENLLKITRYFKENNIPFVVAADSTPMQIVIDAPARIVSNNQFRDVVNSFSSQKSHFEITIDPSPSTQVAEIHRIAKLFEIDPSLIEIDHKTRSIQLTISTEELMQTQSRQKRDQFYTLTRLLTGYSNEPLYDVSVKPNKAEQYLVIGEKHSTTYTKHVQFARLPPSVWKYISSESESFFAKGLNVTQDNLEDFIKFLSDRLEVCLSVSSVGSKQDNQSKLSLDFTLEQDPQKIHLFMQLLDEVIKFEDLNTEISFNFTDIFWKNIFRNLPEVQTSYWVSYQNNQVIFYTESGTLPSEISDAILLSLPGLKFDICQSGGSLNSCNDKIHDELLLPYANEIKNRLRTIIGVGEIALGNNGVLLRLPASLMPHQEFLRELYENFSRYPFAIEVSFDSSCQSKTWNSESLFGLFDSLNPKHIATSIQINETSVEVTCYHQGRVPKYSESFINGLSSVVGKKVFVKYNTHSIFDGKVGIDPSILRKTFGQTDKRRVHAEDKYIEDFGLQIVRPDFSIINRNFKPCGKVFTYDTATQRFDTAIAVNRIDESQIQLQIFVADIASLALPGGFVEQIAMGRIESRYRLNNESLWNNLLPQTIVDLATLKGDSIRRCFVYDVMINLNSGNPIKFNGITYTDVYIEDNIDAYGPCINSLIEEFSLYQECCRHLLDYRRSLGGVIRSTDSELLSETTLLLNYLTGMIGKELGLSLIYHQVSSLFTQIGRDNLLRYLSDIQIKTADHQEIWDKFFSSVKYSSDLETVVSRLQILMQDLLDQSETELVAEIQRRFVGKASHSVTPTYNHIGIGYDVSARIAPALRSVTAVINQSQLLAHYLGVNCRTTEQIKDLIDILENRRASTESLINRLPV